MQSLRQVQMINKMCKVLKKKKSMKTRCTKVLKQLGGEGNYSSKQMLVSCFLICQMSPSQFTYNKSNHRINRNNKDPLIFDATSQLCAESMINEDRKQMVMDRQDGMDPVSFYLSVPCIIRGISLPQQTRRQSVLNPSGTAAGASSCCCFWSSISIESTCSSSLPILR